MALEDEIFLFILFVFWIFFYTHLPRHTCIWYYEWIKMNELRFLDDIREIEKRFFILLLSDFISINTMMFDGMKEMANWSYNASLMLEPKHLNFSITSEFNFFTSLQKKSFHFLLNFKNEFFSFNLSLWFHLFRWLCTIIHFL